jgi:hypothetical protein
MIKDKTREDIPRTLNIKKDFTPGKEEGDQPSRHVNNHGNDLRCLEAAVDRLSLGEVVG